MIHALVDWLVYGLIGLDPTTKLGSSVNFFICDSIKIRNSLRFRVYVYA